ncbi:DUF4159 domain-containing protein [Roseivirga pacifica]|uniref:DUF4159 domain-containing protein n=1 Tax=Roseivirga pacifica TaxID=1267423 RepID=UPI0020956ACC|nr:DUF4159 domain-containing protein [Roseivirga pacifica]MCO6368127.1 DUF4159 domain-containing protein [Roseivirga pacifica]MCO6369391.1 DUF4159 domain-containing protein [Roseivirga pacifica]MCO6373245.1 DUF4159 domain-containing protein [Roseivirga pacifica]MCO6377498.1 DUF4159 domain-containing protein [Roseivirga pacifica]
MKLAKTGFILLTLLLSTNAFAQQATLKMAKLKYNGGGDWYANKTALPNLAKFCNETLNTNFSEQDASVEVGSPELFNYAYLYMTGHGNVVFSPSEAENLRNYLMAGGFLHIDDNYGLDAYIRLEMKKVFPELEFIELPFDHPIYKQKYTFENGIPKIHEHDNKPPQGFGLIYEGKLVCFYSYETDLGNGWEDQRVHDNPEEVRQKALKMGANIISYAFTQN